MDKENVDAQVDVVEQEEQTSEEVISEEESNVEEVDESTDETDEDNESNNVTISKEELTKLKRKAYAYDATKDKQNSKAPATDDYLEDVFMVKELNQKEYESLKNEAKDLGIPFKKYLVSNSGQTLLSKIRTQNKSKESMEKISSKSPVYKKFTQDDLNKMSASEMEKVLSSN